MLPSIINSLKHDKSENIKSNVTDHQLERLVFTFKNK